MSRTIKLDRIINWIDEQMEYTEKHPEEWSDPSLMQGYLKGLKEAKEIIEEEKARGKTK